MHVMMLVAAVFSF